MDSVERFMRTLTHMERNGGRIVRRDDRTLLIYDLSQWSDDQAHALRRRFPECEVQCSANTHSLSGFVVLIRRAHVSCAPCWAAVLLLGLTGASYALITCLRMLQAYSTP